MLLLAFAKLCFNYMKDSDVLALRYSKALFVIAKKDSVINEVLEDFAKIEINLNDLKLKNKLFLSTVVPYSIKLKLWTQLIFKLKLKSLSKQFIFLLLKNNRIQLFQKIRNSFLNLQQIANNIVVAEITSAIPLLPKHKKDLQKELMKVFDKSIELNTKVDPEILGGVIIRMGSKMIDASIYNKLQKLKNKINAIRI